MRASRHGEEVITPFEDRSDPVDRDVRLEEQQQERQGKDLRAHENPRRAIFHGVNNRFTIMWDRLWEKDEKRTSQLVFIGKALDEAKIRAELEKCLA